MIKTQNNIIFNNVKNAETLGVPFGQWPLGLLGQYGPDEDGGIINAIDIDWNGAEVGNDIIINTTGDLLKWIKDSTVNNTVLSNIQNKLQNIENNYVKVDDYNPTINELGNATSSLRENYYELIKNTPDTLDTLREISEKFNANDQNIENIINALNNKVNSENVYDKIEIDNLLTDRATISQVNETIQQAIESNSENVYDKIEIDNLLTDHATISQVNEITQELSERINNNNDIISSITLALSTKDEEISNLRNENQELLTRIKNLERAFHNLVPEEPGDELYNIVPNNSSEPLSIEDIIASMNKDAEKPEVTQVLNMSSLDTPTDNYLIYPLSWEIIENDQIVSPVIKDWNGFEIGFNINEETPTVVVDDIEYRISNIELGKGQYTIEFK